METRTQAVLAIAERLLVDVDTHESPLAALYGSLAELVGRLDVSRVVVAIDDPRCGRQVFSSGRRPFPSWPDWVAKGPVMRTEPPVLISRDAQLTVIRSVGAAFSRALEIADGRKGRSGAPGRPGVPERLMLPLGAAVARAMRYGWGFALVFVAFSPSTERMVSLEERLRDLRCSLRAGDVVTVLGERELALVIEAGTDDEVPPILARLARRAQLPAFSFGLAHCPGDASDADGIIELALSRLAEARHACATQALTLRVANGL